MSGSEAPGVETLRHTYKARTNRGLLFAFRAQCRFDAVPQPLPPGRVGRPVGEGEGAENGQLVLHRRCQRRLGDAGQPRVLGLHGRIERARPFRIGAFRGVDELRKMEVAAPKPEGGVGAGRTEPVDDSEPLAVMITLPG